MMFILYIVALIVFLFLWDYSYDKIHKMRAMKLKEKYLECIVIIEEDLYLMKM